MKPRLDAHEVAFLWAACCVALLVLALTFGAALHQWVAPL